MTERETPLQVSMDAMREALRVSREAGRTLTRAEGHALLKLEVELVQAVRGVRQQIGKTITEEG